MLTASDPHKINCVIYHKACSDGFAAAYAAWRLLGNRAEYIAAAHGEEAPSVRGKHVVCLDFAYPNAITKQLIAEAASFLVIDHHKSTMVDLVDVPQAHFDMTKSGAMLAWEFFHPGEEPPKFIRYVQDRDLWQWKLPYSKEFSASFDMVPFEFERFDEFCSDSVFDAAVRQGGHVLSHKRAAVLQMASRGAKRRLKGFDAMVVNASHWIDEVGNYLSRDAELGVVWYYNHNKKMSFVSLRSNDENVDVSEIAKCFGGGGHRGAAAFRWEGDIEDVFDREEVTPVVVATLAPTVVVELPASGSVSPWDVAP